MKPTTYTTIAAAHLMASLPEEDWRNGKLERLLLAVHLDDEDTLTLTREESDGLIYPDTSIDLARYEDKILTEEDAECLLDYLTQNKMLETASQSNQ
jgi:hypothetical protein